MNCVYCTGPITIESTGGPGVCVLCEVRGVPPNVLMGLKAPWNFHEKAQPPLEQLGAITSEPEA